MLGTTRGGPAAADFSSTKYSTAGRLLIFRVTDQAEHTHRWGHEVYIIYVHVQP